MSLKWTLHINVTQTSSSNPFHIDALNDNTFFHRRRCHCRCLIENDKMDAMNEKSWKSSAMVLGESEMNSWFAQTKTYKRHAITSACHSAFIFFSFFLCVFAEGIYIFYWNREEILFFWKCSKHIFFCFKRWNWIKSYFFFGKWKKTSQRHTSILSLDFGFVCVCLCVECCLQL